MPKPPNLYGNVKVLTKPWEWLMVSRVPDGTRQTQGQQAVEHSGSCKITPFPGKTSPPKSPTFFSDSAEAPPQVCTG